MPEIPRVVISGVGLVSPLDVECEQHFERLLRGESAISSSPDIKLAQLPYQLEGKVAKLDTRRLISNRMLRKLLSRSCIFAVVAAGQALCDGALTPGDSGLENCGLYVGSLSLDLNPDIFIPALKQSLDDAGDFDIARFATSGVTLLDPLFLLKLLPNGGLCGISVEYQVKGPNCNITNGSISGLQAIATATSAIQRGEIELAIAGGYDTLLRMDKVIEHLIYNRLSQESDNPKQACRPFDSKRTGYVLSEGAGFVLLESEAHARKRSAKIYGEILGIGESTEARTLLHEDKKVDGSALATAAQLALQDGHSAPNDLDVVFGDGLATQEDDLREADAYLRTFNGNAIKYTAKTGAVGFVGAAGGSFSFIHAAMSMSRKVIPPMINCERPDPMCQMSFVHSVEEGAIRRCLVWNSDQGIKNVAMLLGAYDES